LLLFALSVCNYFFFLIFPLMSISQQSFYSLFS
jgi:hypothetical protein